MITLSTVFGNGTITIFLTFLVFFVLLIFRKQYVFKVLAIINKVTLPSLITKDLSKLQGYEKLILGYRYWVTKNSL
jgi:hypothetical protein